MRSLGCWMAKAAVVVALVSAAGGCLTSSVEPTAAPITPAGQFLLTAEPAEARSVVDVRASLAESDAPAEVVVVGRVGGLSQTTWDPDRAAFMMADLSLQEADAADGAQHESAPSHDADSCPFCRAKKKKELAGLALVQMVDADDQIPAVDAQRLLGLREGDTIVATGQAHIDNLGALVVRSRGIFVRSRGEE